MNIDYISSVPAPKSNFFYKLCEEGHINIINHFLSKHEEVCRFDNGLHSACIAGHLDIIELMISKGASDWNWGLQGACEGGHMDIIELMISKGASDWNSGLEGACQGGHMDTIELMISKGACDWNAGLYYACWGGNMDIVQLMISKGACGLNTGLWTACKKGHMDIVQLMIDKGADKFDYALSYACSGGNVDIIQLIISKMTALHWRSGLTNAYFMGHMNVVDFILQNSSEESKTYPYFPFNNKKTKYFHNKSYALEKNDKTFMYLSILRLTIVYNRYLHKKKLIQNDLIPDLLKLLYF